MTDAVAIHLPAEPESAGRAREGLEPFRGALNERSFTDLRLLVSELVIEALGAERDSDGERIGLRAELRKDRVRVEVTEGGAAYRLRSGRLDPGDSGWGLQLVRQLSARWELRREGAKTTVSFEMPLSA
jgi:signal transduction histidine kinase